MAEAKRKRRRRQTTRTGSALASREKKVDGEVTEDAPRTSEHIDTPDPHDEVGTVAVGGSLTKNLGDFNSVKVSTVVTLPVGISEEDWPAYREQVRLTKTRASELVEEFLDEEYEAAVE